MNTSYPPVAALLFAVSLNAAEAAPQRALTLKQTMQLAAKRNLSLLSDRLERRRKALEYDAALSTFLPQLSIDTGYDNSTPFDRSLAQDQRLRYGASVDWTAPIGTRVSLGATVDQRLRGATRQSQSVNTANHSSNIALSVTQPLLKGAGTSGAASALAEARWSRPTGRSPSPSSRWGPRRGRAIAPRNSSRRPRRTSAEESSRTSRSTSWRRTWSSSSRSW
jgi:hypothetical protein